MRRITFAVLIAVALFAPAIDAQQPAATRIADRVGGAQRADGFLPFYWDTSRGRVLIEIPAFGEDILYYVSAASGAGSVELPFDRGILTSGVIRFERSGPRVLVVQQNLDYRAVGGSPAQIENVRDSFASSVLAGLPVEAEEGGRVLADATPLFMRDAANVEGRLRSANQGAFRFDAGRSAFYPPRMKAFPQNTEIETVATFAADAPGMLVNNVTPDGRSFTLRIHHSFLKAPEGYRPRPADPRIGVSGVTFRDYARPFNEGTEVSWVTRWRLEKANPGAAMSEPRTPIVFYLDLGIPEPVRTAMREGALLWNRAFEAAGFRNAVQVKDPTPDMDPMDIRYAWILWINRDERGFSSGGTYRDPRTGEILGSKTRMDSHRIRTIGNYWESYSPTTDGGDDCGMFLPVPDYLLQMTTQPAAMPAAEREMVLLRQRLLTAHELGHVMGFGHNFSSSLNNRASVMEYPTPRVKVVGNNLDLSETFNGATGEYDAFMTRYAYTEFPPEKEKEGLEAIIKEMRTKGILYVPSTDPRWSWYDDRATPSEYLRETMAARKIMLDRYGPGILRTGEPIGDLRDMRLWMTYLHHRWAIEAGVRYIGGMFHNIVVKGEELRPTEIVPASTQRDILALLLSAVEPANLSLPETLLVQLTPTPGTNLEDLSSDAAFDHLKAARILSAMVLEPLLEADRATRLIGLSDRQAGALTLPEVVQQMLAVTWKAPRDTDPKHRSLRRVTQRVALDSMMILGGSDDASPEARAYILDQLVVLGRELANRADNDEVTAAHYRQSARDITRYLENPKANAPRSASAAWGGRPRSRFPLPPGPPLGGQ
ncbi:MAG TPA: zinc-dependent metalloprotease [Vicinamibacterales bacterium]|nr:zinc-dependent metalloprotease [Vicinamibacterales bacterium]